MNDEPKTIFFGIYGIRKSIKIHTGLHQKLFFCKISKSKYAAETEWERDFRIEPFQQ